MRYRRLQPIAVVAFALATVACSPSAEARPSDTEVADYIRQALADDARIDAGEVHVAAKDGIITLSGEVDTLATKRNAVLEAKKIYGVQSVINQLSVTSTSRRDVEIAKDVKRRVLNSSTIEGKGIDVKAKNGIVTLTGRVGSWQERQEASFLAGQTRGVRGVQNQFRIDYGAARDDDEIRNDVVSGLSQDVYTNGLPITVTVSDGHVSLTGSVGSAYEKQRAQTDVRWLLGVKSVDNDLVVEVRENHGTRRAAITPPPQDELIKNVHAALARDRRVDSSRIEVAAADGHVTLSGSVKTHRAKELAAQDARDVVGVAWVTDQVIADVDRRKDKAVLDDIAFAFSVDSTLHNDELEVTVKDGVATINGKVGSWRERNHARFVASGVRGVARIDNRITVDPKRGQDDQLVASRLRQAIRWNWTMLPVRNRISVVVTNGVARLTGTVDTWSERNEAARLSWRTEGVRRVENHLAVEGYDYPWEFWQSQEFPEYDDGVMYDWDDWAYREHVA